MLKLKKTEAWPVVSKAFPDYKGRKFKLSLSPFVLLHDTNWGGGSRNFYALVPLSGEDAVRLRDFPPFRNPAEGKNVAVPEGAVVVEYTIFCGKDLGMTLYANTQDLPRLLPKGFKP